MSLSRWVAVAAAVLAIGWYTLYDYPHPADGIGPTGVVIDADDPVLVAEGHQVYAGHCASCHGSNLEGEADWRSRDAGGRLRAPPHDQNGHTWHHPDAALFAITKYGASAVIGQPVETEMPIFNDVLTDREIAAALAYIKSHWPPEIQAKHDALNEKARAAGQE